MGFTESLKIRGRKDNSLSKSGFGNGTEGVIVVIKELVASEIKNGHGSSRKELVGEGRNAREDSFLHKNGFDSCVQSFVV